MCKEGWCVGLEEEGLSEGWRNYLKYLKRGWNRKKVWNPLVSCVLRKMFHFYITSNYTGKVFIICSYLEIQIIE